MQTQGMEEGHCRLLDTVDVDSEAPFGERETVGERGRGAPVGSTVHTTGTFENAMT